MIEFQQFFIVNWQNIAALCWFLLCFRGYTIYAQRAAESTHCLASEMHRYRMEWMQQVLEREVRVADTTAIANLERSVAFLASTTILILAGLITVLGSTEKAIDIVSDIPLITKTTTAQWEMKLLLLIAIFSYAFFKFTWSLRQYGFATVMIGGTPLAEDNLPAKAITAYAHRNANMLSLAANNFNAGLRTYYFSLAVLSWFINIWVFVIMSVVMVWILYRREFKSRTLAELTMSRAE